MLFLCGIICIFPLKKFDGNVKIKPRYLSLCFQGWQKAATNHSTDLKFKNVFWLMERFRSLFDKKNNNNNNNKESNIKEL